MKRSFENGVSKTESRKPKISTCSPVKLVELQPVSEQRHRQRQRGKSEQDSAHNFSSDKTPKQLRRNLDLTLFFCKGG
jgi:hypothetical protein